MRKPFIIGLFAIATCALFAQVTLVTGVVTDGNEPIVGANVLVVGSNEGTITDMDGRFSLNMPDGKCDLQISMIGYKPQLINACDKQSMDIRLHEDTVLSP